MHKIGFSGIDGCGKTTRLNEVKKILSLKSNTSLTSKSDIQNPYDEKDKQTFNSQFFNFSQCINKENLGRKDSTGFLLCDTTILDYYIKWAQYREQKEKTKTLREKDQLLKHLYEYWIKSYDVLFFIRINLHPSKDGKLEPGMDQSIDPEFITRSESLYSSVIQETHPNCHEIWNNGSVDESAHQMVEIISRLNHE